MAGQHDPDCLHDEPGVTICVCPAGGSEKSMADPTESKHTIHVTGWEDWAELELRCHSGPEAPCHRVTDEYGRNPQPIGHCNALEWWGNSDPEELIHGRLNGPPPWRVEIYWDPSGGWPEIRGAGDGPT